MRTLTILVLISICLPACSASSDASSAAGADAVPVKHGGVVVGSNAGDNGGRNFAAASFYDTPFPDVPCEVRQIASCSVVACKAITAADLASLPKGISPGAISIGGTKYPLSLTQSGDGTYLSREDPGPLPVYSGGEMLTVITTGGVVPQFYAELVAPGAITITSPRPTPADLLLISRSAGLPIAWTGGPVDAVSAEIRVLGPSGSTSVTCQFAGADGHGVVPSEALAALTSQSDRDTTQLDISAGSSTTQRVGEYQVSFTAVAPVSGLANAIPILVP